MEIIFLLLAVSVVVAVVFFIVFIVSVKRGQYDDMHTPAVRMLFDDTVKEETNENSTPNN